MLPSARTLVWFRSDLRLSDNTALHLACAGSEAVLGLWVISPDEWAKHHVAACRVDFLLRCARCLSEELQRLHIPLLIRTAQRACEVPPLVATTASHFRASTVHANREYGIDEIRRDEAAAVALAPKGARLVLHHDETIIPPDQVRTQSGGPFTVFTPFKRAWIADIQERGGVRTWPAPKPQQRMGIDPDMIPQSVDGFQSRLPADLWPAGERHAQSRLRRFAAEAIDGYHLRRDRCDLDGTSTLSPYLSAGIISSRQCFSAAADSCQGRWETAESGTSCWIGELIWREFYRQVLFAFPRVSKNRAFKPSTERVSWRNDPSGLAAWQEGRTGFPIVDAAMRCLTATGWMHNRLRMISAMFLTKDLLIDWRLGERHFMQHLVDGDLANNNGGWQWSASTGTDAAPCFRIFNPTTQSAKADPNGVFIRKWVPELRAVQGDVIHDPPPLARAAAGYPAPVVDHDEARARAIRAFRSSNPGGST